MEASPCSPGGQTILSTCSVAGTNPHRISLPRLGALPSTPRPKTERERQSGARAACVPKGGPLAVARRPVVVRAVKQEEQPEEPRQEEPFYATKLFRVAPVILFTLGFIDAGYSGDWSRIGVVTPETEASLRLAAFAVAPTSAVLIWFIFRKPPISTQ